MLPAFSFFSPKLLHINLQNLILQKGNKFFLSISTLIIRYILTPFSLPGNISPSWTQDWICPFNYKITEQIFTEYYLYSIVLNVLEGIYNVVEQARLHL